MQNFLSAFFLKVHFKYFHVTDFAQSCVTLGTFVFGVTRGEANVFIGGSI